MPSPAVLEIEPLLAPISGDNPCGEDIRYDEVYAKIDQLRADAEDPITGEIQPADLGKTLGLCVSTLTDRSKHLMVAAWLADAALRRHGFPGLRDGLKVVSGLMENFWDGLYPSIDPDDPEIRAAPLTWLTDEGKGARLNERILDVPFARGGSGEAYSLAYRNSGLNVPARGKDEEESEYQARKTAAEEKVKNFDSAVAALSPDDARALLEDIEECLAELTRLDGIMDSRLGSAAAGISSPRKALDECRNMAKRLVGEAPPEAPAEGGDGAAAQSGDGAAPRRGGGGAGGGPLESREDALRRLGEVAGWFRANEPHSPVALLVERAVELGRMKFEDLLNELIKDEGAKAHVRELLGIKSS